VPALADVPEHAEVLNGTALSIADEAGPALDRYQTPVPAHCLELEDFRDLLGSQRAADALLAELDGGRGDDPSDVVADQLLARPSERALGCPVDVGDRPVQTAGDDEIFGVLEKGAKARLALTEARSGALVPPEAPL